MSTMQKIVEGIVMKVILRVLPVLVSLAAAAAVLCLLGGWGYGHVSQRFTDIFVVTWAAMLGLMIISIPFMIATFIYYLRNNRQEKKKVSS